VHRFLAIPLLFLVAQSASAQQSTNRTVNARAELARKEITIGDQIYLSVNISAPPGTEVFPLDAAAIDALPGTEIIRAEELEVIAEAPERLLEQRFLITSFDTGYVSISAQAVFFEKPDGLADTAYTNDLLLTVKGAMVTDEDDILPIKPIIAEPRNWTDYWWVYLILLAAVGAVAFREYRRRQTVEAPPPPPPPPPHERALAALDRLEERRLWQQGQTDAYYVELTRILRTYLQDRFGISAREMTSRQITASLQRHDELNRERLAELSELLQLSDLVKFARATPAEELHPAGLERVRAFIRETIPSPPAPLQGRGEPSPLS
jgi:hypothetical protein